MKALSCLLLAALAVSSGLQATIGYRLPGYGTKSLGMEERMHQNALEVSLGFLL